MLGIFLVVIAESLESSGRGYLWVSVVTGSRSSCVHNSTFAVDLAFIGSLSSSQLRFKLPFVLHRRWISFMVEPLQICPSPDRSLHHDSVSSFLSGVVTGTPSSWIHDSAFAADVAFAESLVSSVEPHRNWIVFSVAIWFCQPMVASVAFSGRRTSGMIALTWPVWPSFYPAEGRQELSLCAKAHWPMRPS